jgi:hypothetical protein
MSRAHDDSKGRVSSILICVHQSKTTNSRNREKWFKICLDELGLLKVQKITMLFKIGCGMDKDSRPNYLKMIKEFARQYNKHVIIVVPDQSKFPNTYKTSGSDFTSQSSTNLPHGHTR